MRFHPQTLAKTITYIGCLAPGDYGLFWDDDGTMPWKEFYWALQQESDLAFVRIATLHELEYLGLVVPFVVDGRMLRLRESCRIAPYPPVTPPRRLYYGCLRRSYHHVQEHGLASRHRKYLAMTSKKELAELIAKRRDPRPVPVEIQAAKAHEARIMFRKAGEHLYLVENLPAEYILFPLSTPRIKGQSNRGERKEHDRHSAAPLGTSGSYQLDIEHLQGTQAKSRAAGKRAGKRDKTESWKRGSRGLRDKRGI